MKTGTMAAGDVISAVQIINECIQSIKTLMDDISLASARQSEMIVSVEEGIREIERVVQTIPLWRRKAPRSPGSCPASPGP